MENVGNNSSSQIYVKDLSSIGGIRVSLVKQDGSKFFDSDVDKVFRKACEYSEYGPTSIERFGSSLAVVFANIREGRDFIEDVVFKNDKTNINKNINVILSKNHDTWVEVSLARREGDSFTDSEIQSIFWNAFQYPSLSAFTPLNDNAEVSLHFKNVWEWREFIEQFACEHDGSTLKFKEPANKTKKKGFWENIAEWLNKPFKPFSSDDENSKPENIKNES